MEWVVEIVALGFFAWVMYLVGVDVGRNREEELWRLRDKVEEEKDPEKLSAIYSRMEELRRK